MAAILTARAPRHTQRLHCAGTVARAPSNARAGGGGGEGVRTPMPAAGVEGPFAAHPFVYGLDMDGCRGLAFRRSVCDTHGIALQHSTDAQAQTLRQAYEGVAAPRPHRVRTVATISGQTPVNDLKMQPPQNSPWNPRKAKLQAHHPSSRVSFMADNESQRLLGGFWSFLEASW